MLVREVTSVICCVSDALQHTTNDNNTESKQGAVLISLLQMRTPELRKDNKGSKVTVVVLSLWETNKTVTAGLKLTNLPITD